MISFGKYQLIEKIGRGGMGEVWKARLAGPGGFVRTLVIKRILPHLVEEPRFVKMFFAEARLSAALHHPNIVQVHELGEVDGTYYLAMEHIPGVDLSTSIAAGCDGGPPPPGLAAFVVREICRALSYAHSLTDEKGVVLGLIHRDVSPSNVMLGYEGAVKLLDFGLAKALAESSGGFTKTGALKGKLGYLSPEQVGDMPIDHRVDQWAAGVVLHEALTGRRLFTGTQLEVLALVAAAAIDPPSAKNPSVPPDLDRICLRALERNPEDRYRNCEEMGRELDEVVHALKWGPDRLAHWVRELKPPPIPSSSSGPGPALMTTDAPPPGSPAEWGAESEIPVEIVAAEPPPQPALSSIEVPRQRALLWLVLVAMALFGVGGALLLFRSEAKPSLVAAPPVVDPPPPAQAEPAFPSMQPPTAAPSVEPAPQKKTRKKKPPLPDLERGATLDPFEP
jgi:eukaryotic-like serine/threonine-protein kinase